jgi:hypothetical protein
MDVAVIKCMKRNFCTDNFCVWRRREAGVVSGPAAPPVAYLRQCLRAVIASDPAEGVRDCLPTDGRLLGRDLRRKAFFRASPLAPAEDPAGREEEHELLPGLSTSPRG